MADKIKVLHFYKSALPKSRGGVEVFIDCLCRETTKYGVHNIVLSLAKNPSNEVIQMDGYLLYEAKQHLFIASTGFSLSAFGLFKKLAQNVDVIHYHFPYPFADILHFLCRINKPSLVTYHSDVIRQKKILWFYQLLQKKFLSSVQHIITTSPNYLSSSKVLQNFRNKTTVIPIGIDIGTYPVPNQNVLNCWRERLPNQFFLFTGAMRYYKGLHIALDAIHGTNIQLVFAGGYGIEKELKERALSGGIGNVKFLGSVSEEDKVALLKLCYGFIFPSQLRSEAFGISLLEAAAYGKPLISCEIGTGTSYVNIHNETGLVVTPSSAVELREAMEYLLNNPDKASEFGKKAKERVNKLFTAENQAKLYCELYQNLLVQESS